jgi:uncharacterized protein YgiM (DUF1202 family)
MRRSIWLPLVAIAALAAVAPACQHAEEAPTDYEATPIPPGIETLPLEVVVADRLNVRAGPGAEHPVVGKLSRGAQVRVLEEASGWKRVRPDAGGLEGWVAGEYLQSPSTP